MLKRFFGPKTHDNINMFAVFTIAVGIPLSKVVMSLGTLILALNFLLNADFRGAWERCKKNYVFWFVIMVLAFHLLGLIYTTDLSFAARDLNTKLPLLAIPIVLIAYPIKQSFLKYVIYGFLLSLIITSIINFNFMLNNSDEDYRGFSLFGSHIRYALLIATGIVLSIYLLLKNKKFWIPSVLAISWFCFYLVISKVFSGYIAFLFVILGCFIYFIARMKTNASKLIFTVFLLVIFGIGALQLFNYLAPEKPFPGFKNLPEFTENGERYYNDTTIMWFENGHHVSSLIAGEELEKAWNNRSEIEAQTMMSSGYTIKEVLIRYMTSKGLAKDKAGMAKMTEQDIQNVENEIASIRFTYGPLKLKISELKNEVFHYAMGGDPDGNSLLQRFEHWRAAKTIIKNNWLIGVGTGDLQLEFNQAYAKSNTLLDEHYWNRAHNQFMTFWIAFGIFGFILFLGFWIWFLWKNITLNNFIGICFALIAIGSFLSEDTIETQQGVTYIAFFMGLVSLMNYWKENNKAK